MKTDEFYKSAQESLVIIDDAINQKIKKETAIHLLKGITYENEEKLDEAIAEYNKALETNPTYPEAYNTRGTAYGRGKGLYDLAIADFNKVLELDPRYAGAYNNRAISYYFKKEYDRAWEDVHKAQSLGMEIHPGFIEALRKASGRQR